MHTITLQDGTVLDNLELNGNNYISDTLIDSAVFVNRLATVEINDGKNTQTYKDMKLIANQTHDGKSWIILAEKTAQDKMVERLGTLENSIKKEESRLSNLEDELVKKGIVTEAEKEALSDTVEEEPATKE